MRIEDRPIENYTTYLNEPYRPPSRGGNTGAWHQHAIKIDGERYSFEALGSKKWVFARDTVSFDWEWDASGKYRNILDATIQVRDKAGKPVTRGERGSKPRRTASSRAPGRSSELKD
jgi:hypothetical protein